MVEMARENLLAISIALQPPANMPIAIFRSSIAIFGRRRPFWDISRANWCGVALVGGIQNIDDGWWRFRGVAPLAKLLTRGCID